MEEDATRGEGRKGMRASNPMQRGEGAIWETTERAVTGPGDGLAALVLFLFLLPSVRMPYGSLSSTGIFSHSEKKVFPCLGSALWNGLPRFSTTDIS